MIVDGRAIAKDILAQVRVRMLHLARYPEALHGAVVRAVTVAPTGATRSYLSIKKARATEAGVVLEVVELEADATTEAVIAEVQKEGADAVVVQLSLPSHIDTTRVLNAIPVEKDVDVLSDEAYTRFGSGVEGALVPPVVGAVKEILERAQVDLHGKNVLIVGEGRLVGKPVAAWFRLQNIEPVVINETSNVALYAPHADIIVCGAGSAYLITPEILKQGVVLIDAGTSESQGVLVGDAMSSCADIASLFTPVPGGIGPIAVACLFRNVALILSR